MGKGAKAASRETEVAIARIEGLIEDPAWWRGFRRDMLAEAVPLWLSGFMLGAELGARRTGGKALGAKQDIDWDAIARAAEEMIAGYADEWWGALSNDTARGLRQAIADARVNGWQPDRLAKEIEKWFGPARARRIAVTELTRMMGLGAQEEYRRSGFIGWTWQTVRDDLVDPICQSLQGQEFPMDVWFEPAHVNCLPPGQLVISEGVQAATRRRYEGPVVTIRLTSGNELAVTPNHPVLTAGGWVAAGELVEGDDLIGYRVDRQAILQGPDDEHVPAFIDQVWETLSRAPGMEPRRVPTAAEDFHRDGREGYVEVVGADGQLLDRFVPQVAEPAGERVLVLSPVGSARLPSHGPAEEFARRGLAAPSGHMGSLHLGLARAGRHPGPSGPRGVVASAGLDARLEEAQANDRPVDLVPPAERYLRFPGEVEGAELAVREDLAVVGRVMELDRTRYAGHVYNLQTASGWFVAAGIVVHNCRCWPTPVAEVDPSRVATRA